MSDLKIMLIVFLCIALLLYVIVKPMIVILLVIALYFYVLWINRHNYQKLKRTVIKIFKGEI